MINMTRNHGFVNCEKNGKGYIRHIQIKFMFITSVQYIFAENVPLIVIFHESCKKTKSLSLAILTVE